MAASAGRKVIFAALIGNALIAVTKFVAAAVTGSSAMLSEGIHSVVDTGNQLLLLWGLRQARKPADEEFPFGHGKEVYFWSFVVALLIFAVGAGVSLYEGIRHLMDPRPLRYPMVNYVVLALAMVFEGVAWRFAFREFSRAKGRRGYLEAVREGKDPTMFVVLFEDSAAMLGLAVAFLGVLLSQLTGHHYYDGAASVVIGLILGGTAMWLAYETKGLLIGESAGRRIVQGVREIAGGFPGVVRVNEILTMHMGPDFILCNLSVEFEGGASAADIEEVIAGMDRRIKSEFPRIRRVFVEAEKQRSERGPEGVGDK